MFSLTFRSTMVLHLQNVDYGKHEDEIALTFIKIKTTNEMFMDEILK